MRARVLLIIGVLVLLVGSHLYVYRSGLRDGEQRYKQSIRMYLALKSAYNFGYNDCKIGRPRDWDGTDE